MNKIITSSQVQKEIGKISKSIEEDSFIVTVHGKGRIIMLPYYDGCDEFISEYMEDYEMMKNKKKLQQRYKEASESELSDLII